MHKDNVKLKFKIYQQQKEHMNKDQNDKQTDKLNASTSS